MLKLYIHTQDGKPLMRVEEGVQLMFVYEEVKGFITVLITRHELEQNRLNQVGPMIEAKGKQVSLSVNEFIAEGE